MLRLSCALALTLLLACDQAAQPDPPRPAAVAVTPSKAELAALGATVRLSAAVRDKNGQPMPSVPVTWTSGASAVVTVDGAGVVTAVANGTAAITATAGTVSSIARLTVAQAIESVGVTPETATVVEADTLRLAAVAADANGHEVADAAFAWISADTLVAVVDARGLVKGVVVGAVAIKVLTEFGVTGEAEIEVVAPVPTFLMVTPDTVAFAALGETAALSATVFDQAGRLIEGAAVTWSSGDTAVAIVDSVGVVTGRAEGRAKVTAVTAKVAGTAAVVVSQVAGQVTVAPSADTVELGDTLRVSAEAFDENGHRVAGARFVWWSSDTTLARVDGAGLVRGVGEGTASITVSAGDIQASAEITVENADRTALAYLVQSVQSRDYPVPLVAGRDALLRVFPTAPPEAVVPVPPVRARFYVGAEEVYAVEIPGKPGPLPARISEGSPNTSANALIPGSVLRRGLEMVVEIDPEGTLDPLLGVGRRIPAGGGRTALDVHALPDMQLTVVPFLHTSEPDSSILTTLQGMSENPKYSLLHRSHTLLPTHDWNVTVHRPVWTTLGRARVLLARTRAIRAMEGGHGYWMGMMRVREGEGGVAYLGGWTSFSEPHGPTIAHELGHNMSLRHAPCGVSDADPAYPHLDGAIGAWGTDLFIQFGPGRYWTVPPDTKDMMSYCLTGFVTGHRHLTWISDYHFTNALRHRLRAETSATPARSLLLWGRETESGGLHLEPAFVVDAVPVLPDSAGGYTLTGRDADSRELFSVAFSMPEIADAGEETGGFVYTLPVRPGWEALASLILTAPDGRTAVLDGSTDRPMTILRDARTGQVRAFLDGPSMATQADGSGEDLAAALGAVVITSRGIPDAAAWRR